MQLYYIYSGYRGSEAIKIQLLFLMRDNNFVSLHVVFFFSLFLLKQASLLLAL